MQHILVAYHEKKTPQNVAKTNKPLSRKTRIWVSLYYILKFIQVGLEI